MNGKENKTRNIRRQGRRDKGRNMAKRKIKQIKSRIGAPIDQKRTLLALGLRKISQVVEVEDSPSIRGMVRKVHHLVNVIE